MSASDPKYEKKDQYIQRLLGLLRKSNALMIIGVDNVRSNQFQKIRQVLRNQAEIVMGKNSLMRRAINQLIKEGRTDLKEMLPYIKKNVGLVFLKEGGGATLRDLKKVCESETVGAPAKSGQIAQCDVILKAGPTGLEPTMTSFLQAVGISSKIVKSQIDIISDTVLFLEGQRVSASAATLSQKMKIMPFKYGLLPIICYEDGAFFSPEVLDITTDDIFARFSAAVNDVAAISLQVGYPTSASVPHSFNDAYKNVLAVAIATDYTFPAAKEIKQLLSDPEAMAKLAAAAAAGSAAAGGAEEKKEEKKEEVEEEEADFGGGGLFGGDDDDW